LHYGINDSPHGRTPDPIPYYAQAVASYRDALSLPVVQSWNRPEGSGIILDAGRATLELLSSDMSAYLYRPR
jgi:hypothetical protein